MSLSLTQEEIAFINSHKEETLTSLLLSKRYSSLDIRKLAIIIEANKKIKNKVPEWHNKELIYTSLVSTEQASSQPTAEYKQQFVINKRVADLTGGIGIDSYFISKFADKVLYIEQNPQLCQATTYNFNQLSISNITTICGDCSDKEIINILERFSPDIIYLDPSRRDTLSNKLYNIEDYSPNILDIKHVLFKISDSLLVKISPMVDLSAVIKQLPETREIHIISVENECKELLLLMTNRYTGLPSVVSVNIKQSSSGAKTDIFRHSIDEEHNLTIVQSPFNEGDYLYEPNSSILKGGAFKSIAKKFKLNKIQTNTHLFTNKEFIEDFPGRIFRIEEIMDFNKTNIRKIHKAYPKANVATRNFPLKSEELKKRISVMDGGEIFLFGVTIHDNSKKIIISTKYPTSLHQGYTDETP